MKPVILIFFTICILTSCLLIPSCTKDTTCVAIVNCKDSSGVNALADVNVKLYALIKSADGKTTYTGDITQSGTTNTAGQVRFEFKLPAILDILAVRSKGTQTLTGTGIIKLEEGSTTEKTILLK
ncbi:MAG: hypothetical protein ACO259_03470 [Bacteroidia bacterium]|nr:hypothetical protein [Sphingobacteriia bacterium]